jgi:flagellar hook-basal body complex protein FliE
MNTTAQISNAPSLYSDWDTTRAIDPSAQSSTPFSHLLQDAVSQVNALENQARSTAIDLMNGGGADVHQAVIATQKAEMAFEFAISVRNKAVQAYQSVMGMQF